MALAAGLVHPRLSTHTVGDPMVTREASMLAGCAWIDPANGTVREEGTRQQRSSPPRIPKVAPGIRRPTWDPHALGQVADRCAIH